MYTQTDFYRSIRHNSPLIPAQIAWRQAAYRVKQERWAAAVDFFWGDMDVAGWSERGYWLCAWCVTDEDGWTLCGEADIGFFANRWQHGAIAHDQPNPRTLDWFIPADSVFADQLYKRACDYGRFWEYQSLFVTASRCGIEFDSGEDFFTDTAFELKNEAIAMCFAYCAHSALVWRQHPTVRFE